MNESEREYLEMIRECQPILLKIASFYAKSREDAKDLYAEMVYQLWKSYPAFKHHSKLSTWVYRVCLNIAVGFGKSAYRKMYFVGYDSVPEIAVPANENPNEEIRLLYACIDKLSPLNKSVILMYLDDVKYSEIADVLGISEANVSVRVNRIKKELKAYLKKSEYGNG